MEKSNFDDLLKRYLTGNVSESEKVKIEAWLDIMKTEDTHDMDLSQDDEEQLYQRIVSKRDNTKEIESFNPLKHQRKKNSIIGWAFRIAASIVVVTLFVYSVWKLIAPEVTNYRAGLNMEKFILEDGTIVWLQANTKLSYYYKSSNGTRYCELSGEGLFEVAKDPNHPFFIQCDGANVKVLGTSFNLKTNNGHFEVKVLTGKVNVSTASNAIGINIEPKQKAVLKQNGAIEKSPMVAEEVLTITKGTEYNMAFSDVALKEVFKCLEKKFNISIKANEAASTCQVTADLTDQSLERSLETIEEIVALKFEVVGKNITTTGPGCPTP
ncbi:FecR family protein [Chryseolinea soli]|uniref:FecR family protein n=1 Tax=Chryseolinea soli TaxID=2321403 RepID=A0A385SM25_9BACT|nr:FecR family protein [Chryseolinea soli]AYB32024.1 FecR family protein [Chryseolinea soli]